MTMFLLVHHHQPDECRFAYAAWQGFASPLRHQAALSSCARGDHYTIWTLEAPDATTALSLLPAFIAERCVADPVDELEIP